MTKKEELKKEKSEVEKKEIKKSKIKLARIVKIHNKKTTYTLKEMIVIIIFSIAVGIVMCFSFTMLFYNAKNYLLLTGKLGKFVETYNTITNKYYQDIDNDILLESAIKGMMSAIDDPNTVYTDPETAKDFLEKVEGVYEGIGCEIITNQNGKIEVYTVFEGTPASQSGLKTGDIITHVDGKDYTDKTSADISTYIKESKASKVVLKIIREEKEIEITINRAKIEIPSVSTKIFNNNDKKIGYIKIDIFSSVTDKQFISALEKLEKENISGLVIDVRNNAGGYLEVVTTMLSNILKKGSIVYKLEDKKGITDIKDKDKEHRTYPIAVLTNKMSASASEILAAAIKESYGGYVVGTATYGKATVQKTQELSDGSMLKYTTQKWLTPKGYWINDVGLEPTHLVELNSDYLTNPSDETDNQLQEAIKIIVESL